MARVNVDSQALTDARFAVLANLMGSDDPDLALGRMVRVWMQCLERETPTLPPSIVVAVFRGESNSPDWLVDAQLAQRVRGGMLRIKGTTGRIEWITAKRANGKKYGHLGAIHGTKGGRPKQTPTPGSQKPPTGGVENPPPAPAPAPALKDKEPPFPPELDTPEFRTAWAAWDSHRREKREKLTPTSVSRQLKMLAAMGPVRAVACIEHTITKGWTGLREPEPGRDTPANGKPVKSFAQIAAEAAAAARGGVS